MGGTPLAAESRFKLFEGRIARLQNIRLAGVFSQLEGLPSKTQEADSKTNSEHQCGGSRADRPARSGMRRNRGGIF